MIESITINYTTKQQANAKALEAKMQSALRGANRELEELRAQNDIFRAGHAKLLDKIQELQAENKALSRVNKKMADKLTVLGNSQCMHPPFFEQWLSDRVTVIIK